MIYSKACEYAIRALTYLARHPDRSCLAKEIAQHEGIPHYFLSKILQNLARDGLLRSAKGPGGGFQLAKPPKEFTLYEIKAAVDGVADLEECAVGLERCDDEVPCPLHETFKPLRERIKRYLEETTLEAMAKAVEEKKVL
jgi:Rrf2 family protein